MPPPLPCPSLSDLRALDDLRQTIVTLDGYQQNGAPWTYRFGLYQGNKLDAKRAASISTGSGRCCSTRRRQAFWHHARAPGLACGQR